MVAALELAVASQEVCEVFVQVWPRLLEVCAAFADGHGCHGVVRVCDTCEGGRDGRDAFDDIDILLGGAPGAERHEEEG